MLTPYPLAVSAGFLMSNTNTFSGLVSPIGVIALYHPRARFPQSAADFRVGFSGYWWAVKGVTTKESA